MSPRAGNAPKRSQRLISAGVVWALLACGSGLLSAASAPPKVTAIRAGRVITALGPNIDNAVILIRSGKIVAVGNDVRIPPGAEVMDASGRVVMPGLIASHSNLGESTNTEENVTPHLRAVESFDFYRDRIRLLESGITSAYISPGSGRLLAGQGAVIKLAGSGPNVRAIRSARDFRISFGAESESPPALFRPPLPPTTEDPILPAQRQMGSSLASQVALIRQLLSDASNGSPSSRGALHEMSKGLTEGGSLRIRANRVSEIRAALSLAREQGFRLVIEGAMEGYKLSREIAAAKCPVIITSPVRLGAPLTLDLTRPTGNGRFSADNLTALLSAGVTTALAPENDTDLPNLLPLAAIEVSRGVTRLQAIQSVTLNAAKAVGVGARIGSLQPGRDADLLIMNGDPLSPHTRVESTLVNGSVVYKRKPGAAPETLAIKGGRILTATQGEVRNGVILIRGGKILEVNGSVLIPKGAKVIDASDAVVMPGMIDAHSHVGLHADATQGEPPSPMAGSVSARTRLSHAIAPGDPAFRRALASGVTTVLLAPPTGALVSGRASVLKLLECSGHGPSCPERIVRETGALCFNLQGGAPRMAQAWALREQLQRARDYLQRRSRYEQERRDWERDRQDASASKKPVPREPQEVPVDEDLEAFRALLQKRIPALVHAVRSDEIDTALKVFCDESEISTVLVGASDGLRIPAEIRRRGAAVALGPDVERLVDGKRINLGTVLAENDIPTLFQSSTVSGAEMLRLNAALAVRQGMNPADALMALTIAPARALMTADRLGSIEAGKDADLVILSGDPFDFTSRVRKVLVNGKVVYNEN